MKSCPVTVSIPTYRRWDKLPTTLDAIAACDPAPDEIIVHVDGDDDATGPLLREQYPRVKVIRSERRVGPGGGRNRLLAAASNRIVASFDDDSYPLDRDYFGRLLEVFERYPSAAVVGSAVYHIGEQVQDGDDRAEWVADFTGCGCAYRRDVFHATSGYVSLPVAYGMEEADLALRVHELGWRILSDRRLRVFHNTRLEHHLDAKVTAASIANQALLAYLRYPAACWPIGFAQFVSRILWLVRHARLSGVVGGICGTPAHVWRHRRHREVVSAGGLLSFLRLRRRPVAADITSAAAPEGDVLLSC